MSLLIFFGYAGFIFLLGLVVITITVGLWIKNYKESKKQLTEKKS